MIRGISNSVVLGRGMMSAVMKTVLLLVVFAAAASRDSTSQSSAATQPAAPSETTRNAQDFVGNDACRGRHREHVETYHHTAHFLTSRPADGSTVLGAGVCAAGGKALFRSGGS